MNLKLFSGVRRKVKLIPSFVCCTFHATAFYYSPETKNYYEILGLDPTCTTKEIKEAYVKLCKMVHPDASPNSSDMHKKFVHLNEAYTVLVRSHTRKLYDQKLKEFSNKGTYGQPYFHSGYDADYQRSSSADERNASWRDETVWSMRDRSKDKFYEESSYYGIKGVKRVSNSWIVFGCLLLMAFGIAFHYAAFRFSITFNTKKLDEKDKINSLIYSRIRSEALKHGRQHQVERFMKILGIGPEEEKKDTGVDK